MIVVLSVCVQPCVQTSQMVLSLGIYNELYKYKNTAIPVLTLRSVAGGGGGISIGEENHWHRVKLFCLKGRYSMSHFAYTSLP
jgi:hypothetical protein